MPITHVTLYGWELKMHLDHTAWTLENAIISTETCIVKGDESKINLRQVKSLQFSNYSGL